MLTWITSFNLPLNRKYDLGFVVTIPRRDSASRFRGQYPQGRSLTRAFRPHV